MFDIHAEREANEPKQSASQDQRRREGTNQTLSFAYYSGEIFGTRAVDLLHASRSGNDRVLRVARSSNCSYSTKNSVVFGTQYQVTINGWPGKAGES